MAAQRSARKHFATHAHPGFAPRAYDHPPPTEPQSVPVLPTRPMDLGAPDLPPPAGVGLCTLPKFLRFAMEFAPPLLKA
eukprot:CAMPEP_0181204260 /NCGR_PEP_ID=MMETSP1096-20121128/19838_1 /TAXON_ID=156174 ORGANISM="Chrysochromulina ericina, Strain CCMP281" /NCGR_SAMPLE_ID=MMETSP1096 /ASSEMBLY_ACC=CAM_ASM_000453 /LENGTH=78 /DNA_ID=CAMNT_0023294943 /DNA_START=476 /DNA_END=712 /DNA_ORIENTATION=-